MLQRGSSTVERGPVYDRAHGRAAGAAVFLALLAPRLARAAGAETAMLVYERPAELEACPDETAFRSAVSARLGRDPFASNAERTIVVRLSQSGSTLSAVVIVEQGGSARGERRIDTRAGCDELASGAALAVSIAIDPLAALGPTSPTEAEPAPAEPAAQPAPQPAPPPKPPSRETAPPAAAGAKGDELRAGLFVRAGGRAWLGAVPSLSAGPNLGFGYRRGFASLALDGIGVLSQNQEEAGTARAVSVGIVGGELSPCAHFADLRACALFGSGALLARGEGVTEPRTGEKWTAWTGLSAGYSFTSGRFSITPTAELALRLTTTELTLNSDTLWTTPRLFGSFGLELSYDFSR